jgi:hypothetical protein
LSVLSFDERELCTPADVASMVGENAKHYSSGVAFNMLVKPTPEGGVSIQLSGDTAN